MTEATKTVNKAAEVMAQTVQIGTVVDSVSEVLNVGGSDIEKTPSFGTKLDTEYVLGMAKIGGGVKTLLDIDHVLNDQEVVALQNAALILSVQILNRKLVQRLTCSTKF